MSSVADVMTLREAADYLRVHWRTLADWAREGRVPVSRLGRAYRFRRAVLDRWLDEGGTEREAIEDEGLLAAMDEAKREVAEGREKLIPWEEAKAALGL